MSVERELVDLDVRPSGARDSQSGLQLLRPKIYGVLSKPRTTARVACIIMHPVSNFMSHYLLKPLAERGIACLALNSRYVNNDTMLILERVIQDLGAGVRFLRDRGYQRIVLLGNSGGAALVSMYQAQAERFTLDTLVDGSPSNLSSSDFPTADCIVLMGAHEGRALLLEKWIDPAVVDENDPLRTDPAIDMFDPKLGPPYSDNFLVAYRAAQVKRRDRIETWVWDRLRQLRRDPSAPQDQAFVIHRTLADPRCLDLSLDPNDRERGTIWGDARTVNYAANSVGRFTSLHSFLSQWSSSSRGDGPACLAKTTIPVLHFTYTADASTFPSTRHMWMLAAGHRAFNVDVKGGNHYLAGQPQLVDLVSDQIAQWSVI
jgi:pimeloyl-ACP methyl ester carboxylesterase